MHPETIADGLLTSLGKINFSVISEKVDDILTVLYPIVVKKLASATELVKPLNPALCMSR